MSARRPYVGRCIGIGNKETYHIGLRSTERHEPTKKSETGPRIKHVMIQRFRLEGPMRAGACMRHKAEGTRRSTKPQSEVESERREGGGRRGWGGEAGLGRRLEIGNEGRGEAAREDAY